MRIGLILSVVRAMLTMRVMRKAFIARIVSTALTVSVRTVLTAMVLRAAVVVGIVSAALRVMEMLTALTIVIVRI